MATHLRRSKPEIRELLFHQGRLCEDVNMEDLSSNSKDANVDIETIKVAMLSGLHIFEGRREFYFLRRMLLDRITSDSSAAVVDILQTRRSYGSAAVAYILWIQRSFSSTAIAYIR